MSLNFAVLVLLPGGSDWMELYVVHVGWQHGRRVAEWTIEVDGEDSRLPGLPGSVHGAVGWHSLSEFGFEGQLVFGHS